MNFESLVYHFILLLIMSLVSSLALEIKDTENFLFMFFSKSVTFKLMVHFELIFI